MNTLLTQPLIRLRKTLIAAMLSFSLLSSCGDPVTTAIVAQVIDAGVGGTGIVRGIITGFGSVYVNGIKFEVDNTDFSVDGDTATNQSDLSKGMLVTIKGTINADGITGTAASLVYDDDIEGPISSPVFVAGSDQQQKSFTIFGQTITVDALSTYFEDTSFDTLSINDIVEISGNITASNTILATLVKHKGVFVAGTSPVELKGTISDLNLVDNNFILSGTLVSYDESTTELDLDSTPLGNGLFVEVEGILQANGSIVADKIELEDDGFSETDGDINLSGIISDYNSSADFKLNGQAIDASQASSLEPSNALDLLADGVHIELEGSLVNGVIVATEIELELDEIKLSAIVQSKSSDSITIAYPNLTGAITITVDNSTQFEDDSMADLSLFSLLNINASDYVEIKASFINGNIVASKIQRDDLDDYILQGEVESFIEFNSITILGITYTVDALTEYDDFNNSLPSLGDIVRVKDEDRDGTADKISLE